MLSEDLAFEGCADLLNEIGTAKNVEFRFTGPQLIKQFVGQNFRGMMKTLEAQYDFTLSDDETESYVRREEDVVIAKLQAKLKPCDGVDDVLRTVDDKYTLAVVSSSALRRVQASIDKVGQAGYFGDRVFSAATSIDPPTSKPDPAVYLHAMEVLGVSPSECVAIEDSRSGTLAGSRAGIKVIGYVGPYSPVERDGMAKVLTEAGAVAIMQEWKDFHRVLSTLVV